MRTAIRRRIITGLWFLLPLAVLAQNGQPPLQSDWLELVKGYREDTMGVELREVEDDEADGTRKITLAIPKSAMSDPNTIEEVVVVGRRPEKREFKFDASFEWLDENGMKLDSANDGWTSHILHAAEITSVSGTATNPRAKDWRLNVNTWQR